MAYEVLLDPAVALRVDDVVAYLADELHSSMAAISFLDGFDGLVDKLSQRPLSYPHVHDARLQAHGYRKALVGNYVVLFRVWGSGEGEGSVWVTNLFHGSQNYQELV